jgi:hypothetical protein
MAGIMHSGLVGCVGVYIQRFYGISQAYVSPTIFPKTILRRKSK